MMTINPLFQHPFMSDRIINSMAQNIVVIDKEGFIIHTNNQWDEFCNKNSGDIKKCGIGVNYFEVCRDSRGSVGIDEMVCIIKNVEFVLEGEKRCFSHEYPCHSPDKKRWFLMYVTPLRQGSIKITGAVIVHVDITTKKLAEEHMIYQERLSAIGQLAATIAHEIRNPLTTLKGFWQLFKEHPNHTLQAYSEVINQEIQEMEDIINRFMILSGPIHEQVEEANMMDVLKQSLQLMELESNKYTVTLSYPFRQEDMLISCNINQLIQAFKNIISNALASMPNGGNLTIYVQLRDKSVEIDFEDEGCGIPDDLLSKLGEPFYLTDRQGSGFGLMLVYQIIYKYKGTVLIESKVDHGTKVKIRLPIQST